MWDVRIVTDIVRNGSGWSAAAFASYGEPTLITWVSSVRKTYPVTAYSACTLCQCDDAAAGFGLRRWPAWWCCDRRCRVRVCVPVLNRRRSRAARQVADHR
jgi:hypothetical protein